MKPQKSKGIIGEGGGVGSAGQEGSTPPRQQKVREAPFSARSLIQSKLREVLAVDFNLLKAEVKKGGVGMRGLRKAGNFKAIHEEELK